MRIVIDMQGAQAGSAKRGIGRYSLAFTKAMIRQKGEHEIFLVFSDLFPESLRELRAMFEDYLPASHIHVWSAPGPVDYLNHRKNQFAAELVRETFLASLQPDVVVLTSLFEGGADNVVTNIGAFHQIPTAVIFYDLIPLIYSEVYFTPPEERHWYRNKLSQLRRADLLLCISEASRQDVVRYLGIAQDVSAVILGGVEPEFCIAEVSAEREAALRERYALTRSFVMYTGGIDHRKNIPGLIRSYAQLPDSLRASHQLTIVCQVNEATRKSLGLLLQEYGLAMHEVVFTGFVPDEDLVDLYRLCKAFIFPSYYEGFGLPVLEALACGRPVIAANTSSLPEVLGCEAALFDPCDDGAITQKLEQVLSDEAFRASLVAHASRQVGHFSWDLTAKRAIAALSRFDKKEEAKSLASKTRLKLAYISPLPPERSGISDYSVDLIPALSRYYDIDLIVAQSSVSGEIGSEYPIRTVKWFQKNHHRYDRVLYHIGNSFFHQHMFGLLKDIPGVVVLHDYFLSPVLSAMAPKYLSENALAKLFYDSHGYSALRDRYSSERLDDQTFFSQYPANAGIFSSAFSVLVHSRYTKTLAERFYGNAAVSHVQTIPHLHYPLAPMNRLQARAELGLNASDFVVCSFGMLAEIKQNMVLIDAFAASALARHQTCRLIFVGEMPEGDYTQRIMARLAALNLADRIHVTGWVDQTVFRRYLAAADIGVQLRTLSRGESSAAVLDCMSAGLATIVNANGSMADLPQEAVYRLADDVTQAALTEALEDLWQHQEKRIALGERARQIILTHHTPSYCADIYRLEIEKAYAKAQVGFPGLMKALGELNMPSSRLMRFSQSLAKTFPNPFRQPQLLVDVSMLIEGKLSMEHQAALRKKLVERLLHPPAGYRVEPVYATRSEWYRYARKFTLELLGCHHITLEDAVIDFKSGDRLLLIATDDALVRANHSLYDELRLYGVEVSSVF